MPLNHTYISKRRLCDMDSFAIWYSGNSDSNNQEAWIHINLWKTVKKKISEITVDFGILVQDIKDITSINLYCPFEVSTGNVTDIVPLIKENPALINAIFNKTYSYECKEAKMIVKSQKGNERRAFVLSPAKFVTEEKSIIKINTEELTDKDIQRHYFRIRIVFQESDYRGLFNAFSGGTSLFTDFFTSTEIIDFRLNDMRSCKEEIIREIKRKKCFNINSVNYFILREPTHIIIYQGGEVNSRFLETDIWEP